MIIIVGERLNSSRRPVLEAMQKRDMKFLLEDALKQEAAGAHFIDLNAASLLDNEVDTLRWAVPLLQEKLNIPLSIDTPNSRAMEEGLKSHKGRALLNSLTYESKKLESLLPIIKKYRPYVIALCMDEKGLPQTPEEELSIASKIVNFFDREGVNREDIFIDPLVRPVSVDQNSGLLFLESLKKIKRNLPEVKTIAGLSNISFGLPNRRLINRTFLALALKQGLDAAILDPLDKKLLTSLSATQALLGKDPSLKNYLRLMREK